VFTVVIRPRRHPFPSGPKSLARLLLVEDGVLGPKVSPEPLFLTGIDELACHRGPPLGWSALQFPSTRARARLSTRSNTSGASSGRGTSRANGEETARPGIALRDAAGKGMRDALQRHDGRPDAAGLLVAAASSTLREAQPQVWISPSTQLHGAPSPSTTSGLELSCIDAWPAPLGGCARLREEGDPCQPRR